MQRLFNGGIQEELSKIRVSPTFGVSFGLPQSGDYPVNPLTGHPIINPYGHTINGNGVKLGPVAVNPLLAVQVTKDESGEKVVKPVVNLHVTPTHGFIHKIGGLKHKILDHLSNDHHDYHDHHYHHEVTYSKPHNYHTFKPTYSEPWNDYAPSYSDHYDHHDHYDHYEDSGYYDNKYLNEYEYYDKSDNYHNGYDRNGKSLNVTGRPGRTGVRADDGYDHPSKSSASSSSSFHQSSNSNQPSSDHVSFPRSKRDVSGKSVEKVSYPLH